jgi:hypothetical protein
VKIGAAGAAPDELRALAEWGDRHSPVGCTLREARGMALDVELA